MYNDSKFEYLTLEDFQVEYFRNLYKIFAPEQLEEDGDLVLAEINGLLVVCEVRYQLTKHKLVTVKEPLLLNGVRDYLIYREIIKAKNFQIPTEDLIPVTE